MNKELDMLKRELDRRMYDLAKMSGTNKQRAEVYRTMQVIRRIESLHSCPNCTHWNDGICDIDDDDATQSWVCRRNCTDFFEPRWEDGNE